MVPGKYFFFGSHNRFLGLEKANFFNSSVVSKNWGAPLNFRKSSFIKGAANCQRTAVNFAGKCRLVRRGGEWAAKPENDGNTQIRLKYEYEYTGKDKKYTNTKIQTHTNTNITIGSLSQIRRGKKWDFLKKSSHENGSNFCSRILSKGPRVAKTNLFHRARYPKARWSQPKIFLWVKKWLKA